MGLLSNYRGNIRFWLKGYLLLGVAILIGAMLIYSNHLTRRMEDQAAATSRLFSQFIANVVFKVQEEGKLRLLQDVIGQANLPVIITVRNRPVAWRNVSVAPMEDTDWEVITTMDLDNPPAGKMAELMKLTDEFDRINEPVPIDLEEEMEDAEGLLHFGTSRLQKELQVMPFIQLGLFLVFMGVALQGARYLKMSEQRSVWVGMAKETAHQLGTPLSALLGWTQLIEDKVSEKKFDDLGPSIKEMQEDLRRLEKISDRFSKIGSQPELRDVEVAPLLERTVNYFERRLPRLKANSTISLTVDESPTVRANEELLEWVFENLIKNGLDAMGDAGGKIDIWTKHQPSRRRVEMYVRDTGKGIPAGMRERIFRPGFTTKKRGWGLGLALARRIVQDYHRGSIRIHESRPGKGTTFVIKLPVA